MSWDRLGLLKQGTRLLYADAVVLDLLGPSFL